MVNLSYSLDDAKSLATFLDLAVRVLGQQMTADNADVISEQAKKASDIRKTLIESLKGFEKSLEDKAKTASTAPAN